MALILRVCGPNGESFNGFKWPLEVGAVVEAPDWDGKPECGGGLHGWLHGAGDHSVSAHVLYSDAKWVVVEADEWIEIGGKVKFPRCVVRFVGDSKSATDYLWEHDPESRRLPVIGAHRSDMRVGAVVIVGALGHATAGYGGSATAGDGGSATAGYGGSATAGDGGSATAGDGGSATAGDWGSATAGYGGSATAGYKGSATAGDRGSISILYFDGRKYRRKSGDIGENGLKPNVKYRIENGQFVEAK